MSRVSQHIFSVSSAADLGVRRYYLDEIGLQHILIGHRDLRSFTTGIEEAVKNPTHVYRSAYHSKRFQFVSTGVVTSRGHPMNVIIELDTDSGRVVTATFKKKINGAVVWDQKSGLYASYDGASDVLYFSCGDARVSYAEDDEEDERIWLRRHEDDDTPSGITVFDAENLLKTKRSYLTNKVAGFLMADIAEVERRLGSLQI
jgi:uncharacterized protein YuzE